VIDGNVEERQRALGLLVILSFYDSWDVGVGFEAGCRAFKAIVHFFVHIDFNFISFTPFFAILPSSSVSLNHQDKPSGQSWTQFPFKGANGTLRFEAAPTVKLALHISG